MDETSMNFNCDHYKSYDLSVLCIILFVHYFTTFKLYDGKQKMNKTNNFVVSWQNKKSVDLEVIAGDVFYT